MSHVITESPGRGMCGENALGSSARFTRGPA